MSKNDAHITPRRPTMDKKKLRVLTEYATNLLFDWLTKPENEAKTRDFLNRGASPVLRKKVKLIPPSVPEGADDVMSQTMLTVAAAMLSNSFGIDAPDATYPMDSWAGTAALCLSFLIDFQSLADRLLSRYVPEYVPGELPRVEAEDDAPDA
jgi:hypothetical protein